VPARVSIGLPTYNRGPQLDLAVASALAQTHREIELVISDNASTDDTPERCAAWAQRDPRVRVIRHAENRGPTENFNGLFATLEGPFVLMLADDDRLDADYVATCLAELQRDPGLSVAAGTARYVRGREPVRGGKVTDLQQATAGERVLAYFASADEPFYGVVRREALRAAAPMPNVLANDWLHVGRLAATGRVSMLESTHVTRELGGTSATIEGILAAFGAGTLGARVPHLVMAWAVLADVGWRAPAHARIGSPVQRALLAPRCALGVIDWRSLAWHLTAPAALGLARRPRGRGVAHAYDRLTKALGAGRQP